MVLELPVVPIFSCTSCGNCCTFDTSLFSNQPLEFVQKSSLLRLSPPGLLVQDWEKSLFDFSIIKPSSGFFDIKNNRVIVLYYTFHIEKCPNLVNLKCTIYDKRPISCRLYPCSFRDAKYSRDVFSAHGSCPAELSQQDLDLHLSSSLSLTELRKRIFARYGDGFAYGVITEMILKKYIQFITDQESKGLIKLAKEGYPLEFLSKRMQNVSYIDISELFFETTGHKLHEILLSPAGISETIRKIKDSK